MERGSSSCLVAGREVSFVDGFSFAHAYEQIFLRDVYRFPPSPGEPVTILDCGGNVGLVPLRMRELYPNAAITSVEADPEIYSLLVSNTAGLDVTCVPGAVAAERGEVPFWAEGTDSGRLRQAWDSDDKVVLVRAHPLSDLITGPLSLLKVDIEGAEVDALLSAEQVLALVERVSVEYHSFSALPQRLGELLSLLERNGFRYEIEGESPNTPRPFHDPSHDHLGMDLQLNIHARRTR